MKQSLFTLYNKLKEEFIEALKQELEGKSFPIEINYEYMLSDHTLKNLNMINYEKGKYYVLVCYTDEYLDVDEQWEKLRDLSIDDLYNIGDKL